MTALPIESRDVTPGLYPGIVRAEYESINAINVSRLEHFERSAAHAREVMLHPPAPTAAMDLGTAIHCAILEPARFATEYVAAPKVDRRTKDGKKAWADFEAEHPNVTAMDASEFITVLRMRDSVWSHPIASELLRGIGFNEVAVVWDDEDTGVRCKGLIDRIGTFVSWTWIVDIKKTPDARAREFSRSVKKFHYGAKAAFYLDGCNVVSTRDRRFAWVAIEDSAPYGVMVYETDDTALQAGRSKYRRWLRLYEEAVRTGNWPCYEPQIAPMSEEQTEWR